MPLLQVNNIYKDFGTVGVLKGVSFSLEQGQVLAIIGSSGGGKSTLLRCLNFLETPDAGEIWVGGQQLLSGSEEEIRQNRLHFGLVFQNFNLFPQYTVLENITLVKDTSLARIIGIYEIIWAGESFIKKGLLWPLFYTGAFYLLFSGLLTILFGKLEKKLDYFRG